MIFQRMQQHSCRELAGTISSIWAAATPSERMYMLLQLGVNYYLVHFGLNMSGKLEDLLKSSCSIRQEARLDLCIGASTAVEFLMMYDEKHQEMIADRCLKLWGVPLSAVFDHE